MAGQGFSPDLRPSEPFLFWRSQCRGYSGTRVDVSRTAEFTSTRPIGRGPQRQVLVVGVEGAATLHGIQ